MLGDANCHKKAPLDCSGGALNFWDQIV